MYVPGVHFLARARLALYQNRAVSLAECLDEWTQLRHAGAFTDRAESGCLSWQRRQIGLNSADVMAPTSPCSAGSGTGRSGR